MTRRQPPPQAPANGAKKTTRTKTKIERDYARRPPIPGFDDKIGAKLRDIRGVIPRWQVAMGMSLAGQPAPRTAYLRARVEAEGLNQDLRDQLGVVVRTVEEGKSGIHLADFIGVCEGLNVSPARVLESVGLATPAISVEDGIDSDSRLNEQGKKLLRQDLEGYLSNPVFLV